jgi:hypothetical protein
MTFSAYFPRNHAVEKCVGKIWEHRVLFEQGTLTSFFCTVNGQSTSGLSLMRPAIDTKQLNSQSLVRARQRQSQLWHVLFLASSAAA